MEKENLLKRILNKIKKSFLTLKEAYSEPDSPQDLSLDPEEYLTRDELDEYKRIQAEWMEINRQDKLGGVKVQPLIGTDIDIVNPAKAKAKSKKGPALEGPSLD